MKKLFLLCLVAASVFMLSSCNIDFQNLFPWNTEEYKPVVFLSYDFSDAADDGFIVTDVSVIATKKSSVSERGVHTVSLAVDQANKIATGVLNLPSNGIYAFSVEIRSNGFVIGSGTADLNINSKEYPVGISDSGSSSGNTRISVNLEKTFEMKTKMGISFGLNQYQNISNIPFCLNDAADFEIVMNRQMGETVISTYTGLIFRDDITTGVQALCNRDYSKDDIFFFHYAGHGGLDNRGKAFLAMSNYSRASGSSFYVEDLKTLLDRIKCSKVVIIDACNSEEFTQLIDGREVSGEEYSEVFEEAVLSSFFGDTADYRSSDVRNSDGYYIMVGCAKNESSWETKEHQNGLFSFYIFDGLGMSGDENPTIGYNGTYDADENSDGSITFHEIFRYSYDKVSNKIINGQSGLQHPQAFPLNSQFVLFKY